MVRIIIAFVFVMLFFSCKRDQYSGDHLSKEVMQKVMLDINLAEAYSISAKDSLHRAGAKNVDSLSAFYKRIFDHYKITEQEFTQSLDWYKSHPEELDSVYARIIPIANRLQAQLPPAKTPIPATPIPPQGLPAAPAPLRTPAPPATHPATIHPNVPNGRPHPVPQRSVGNANSN